VIERETVKEARGLAHLGPVTPPSRSTVAEVQALSSSRHRDVRHPRDSSADAYAFCDAAHKRGAQLAGVALSAFREKHWLELRSDEALFLDAATVRAQITALREMLPEGNSPVTVTLATEAIKTPSGQDLRDLIEDLKGQLDLAKVRQ